MCGYSSCGYSEYRETGCGYSRYRGGGCGDGCGRGYNPYFSRGC